MSYRLELFENNYTGEEWEYLIPCWRNFVESLPVSERRSAIIWDRMKEYKAAVHRDERAIIFQTEEDALFFKLRWS